MAEVTEKESIASRLAAIRERAAKATSGPWEQYHRAGLNEVRAGAMIVVHWGGFDGLDMPAPQTSANAVFIASARDDIDFLLELLATQRAEGIAQGVQQERERLEAVLTKAREIPELWRELRGSKPYRDPCGDHQIDYRIMPDGYEALEFAVSELRTALDAIRPPEGDEQTSHPTEGSHGSR